MTKLDRCIASLMQGNKAMDKHSPCVQVIEVRQQQKAGEKKLIVTISDGVHSCPAIIIKPTQKPDKFSVIKILESLKHTRDILLIVKYTIEETLDTMIGSPKSYTSDSNVSESSSSTTATGTSNSSASRSSSSNVSEHRKPVKKSAGVEAADSFYDDGGMSSVLQEGEKMTDDQVAPITSIGPYEQNWVIKARITQKSDLKHWDKGTTKGCLFSIELLDEWNGQIRATFFNDAAKKYVNVLKEGGVYFFSGGKVKDANKKFTTIPHNYEITFDRTASIQAAKETAIPEGNFNFTRFCDVASVEENAIVDIIGVVKQLSEVKDFTTKNNRKTKRCNVTLIDNSSNDPNSFFQVDLTIWGDMCDSIQFNEGDVVIFKNVRKSNYNGISLNTVNNTRIITRSSIPEYQALAEWCGDHSSGFGDEVAIKLTQRQTAANSTKTFKRKNVIQDIKNTNVEDVMNDALTFYLRAYVSYIKPDLWYEACPNEKCHRKVQQDGDRYVCNVCGPVPSCIRQYKATFAITDWTGKQWCLGFNNAVLEIFDKVSADEMCEKANIDTQYMPMVLSRANWTRFVFYIRVTADRAQNNEMKLKYTASRIYNIDYATEAKSILSTIKDYGF
ncbi:hypothetical protein C9374_005938 [Naegleria lovaniensis]|uniref:Replication protein A subunit n=1 Tax=Naegleria lovaniensis TaxID=51637 RepID=A0AA88GIF3_NAELO|nr:uncharacterized protein C9374_005938 [Naegleria lovaniensis]KAG2381554.1 hypothetical protein C9374_005938 [Naegleria lovaniensis]